MLQMMVLEAFGEQKGETEMIFEERTFDINGKELVMRAPREEDAEMLRHYIKKACGETRFLMAEGDEMDLSLEEELEFINSHRDSKSGMLILGFLDGEHVGNCSFEKVSGSRRYAHRVSVGIALLQKFTGQGVGKTMFGAMLEEIEKLGIEQAELIVIEGNDRAKHMYENFGFKETGRRPKANKYDDGTYADDIFMVKSFR